MPSRLKKMLPIGESIATGAIPLVQRVLARVVCFFPFGGLYIHGGDSCCGCDCYSCARLKTEMYSKNKSLRSFLLNAWLNKFTLKSGETVRVVKVLVHCLQNFQNCLP